MLCMQWVSSSPMSDDIQQQYRVVHRLILLEYVRSAGVLLLSRPWSLTGGHGSIVHPRSIPLISCVDLMF